MGCNTGQKTNLSIWILYQFLSSVDFPGSSLSGCCTSPAPPPTSHTKRTCWATTSTAMKSRCTNGKQNRDHIHHLKHLAHILEYIYTGCNRRNVRDFGRVFLSSNYTDITQNTFIQSWTVMEILAREKSGLLWCLRTVLCPWRHTPLYFSCIPTMQHQRSWPRSAVSSV